MNFIDMNISDEERNSIQISFDGVEDFNERAMNGSLQQEIYNQLLILKEEYGNNAYPNITMRNVHEMFCIKIPKTICEESAIQIAWSFYNIVVAVLIRFRKELLYA